jgi:hypothetical protein
MRRATHLSLTLVAVLVLGQGVAAQSETDEGIGAGGRIEVREASYAVTIPETWVSIRPSAATVDVILDEIFATLPQLGPTIEAALGSGLGFSLLALTFDPDLTFTENCNVLDRPSTGETIEEIGADEIAKLDGFEDLLVNAPTLTFVDLPTGLVAKMDLDLRLPQFDTASTSYIYTDATLVHTLTCTDLARPEDDWLSIAETFEFLATE